MLHLRNHRCVPAYFRPVRLACAFGCALFAFWGSGEAAGGAFGLSAEPPGELSRRWAFEAGVAFITENNIDQLIRGNLNMGRGDPGGRLYLFRFSYLLHEFEWELRNRVYRPQLEAPLTLGIVDENGRSPFLDYNAAVMVRWVDFPWNDYVYTTFGSGVGLSYSEKILAMDRHRHPDRERSHLKFTWPNQITFAHPRHRHHQLVLFLEHQSGGKIFDRGGVNSLGVGYRFGFE